METEEEVREELKPPTIAEIGKFRAAEALAAIQAHTDPIDYCTQITVAQSIYMLAAVLLNVPEEKKEQQLQLFGERLASALRELSKTKEEHERAEQP